MELLPAFVGTPERDTIYHLDIFALCAALPDASVDMILCDLPYGTTACSWDEIIPFEPMWAAFKRVIKPDGAIVLTASQPFTSKLVCSNLEMFRYEWMWDKKLHSNFLNVNRQPLKAHESILVFGVEKPTYYPILKKGLARKKGGGPNRGGDVYGHVNRAIAINDIYYPKSVIEFSNANQSDKQHPTQKPIALFEYLIKTYTHPGELVFDPCVGSGTTALAAYKTGRHFICGDITREYVDIARERLDRARLDKPIYMTPELQQRTLFESSWA